MAHLQRLPPHQASQRTWQVCLTAPVVLVFFRKLFGCLRTYQPHPSSGRSTPPIDLLCRHLIFLKNLYRFWLCRAVESWLRSSSQFGVADQLFVISRGLLQHIVHVLLESESASEPSVGGGIGRQNNGSLGSGPPREVAQSSFDLLGEMIRFNMEACRQLDILLSTEAKVLEEFIDPFTFYQFTDSENTLLHTGFQILGSGSQ